MNLKPGGKVDVDIPDNDGDLNAQYDDQMKIIAQKAPKEVKALSAEDKQSDYYKGFRSGVVLVWIFSNLVLAAAILSTDIDDLDVSNKNQTEEQRAIIYMQVILFSVAGLSAFRFIGAMWFLVLRLVCAPFYIDLAKSFLRTYLANARSRFGVSNFFPNRFHSKQTLQCGPRSVPDIDSGNYKRGVFVVCL